MCGQEAMEQVAGIHVTIHDSNFSNFEPTTSAENTRVPRTGTGPKQDKSR